MLGTPKSTLKVSSEQEEFIASELDIKRTPRSGGTISRKGDLFDELSLFECKTYMSEKDSFTVKKEVITKMNQERFQDRKRFAFLINNFGGKGSKDNYVTMDLETFKELYNYYKEHVLDDETT